VVGNNALNWRAILKSRGLAVWVRCAVLAGAVSVVPVGARAAGFERQPEPSWVERIAPEFDEVRPGERERDSFTLLSDSRVRLRGSGYHRYERRVRRALTASGVERLAQLLVDFEPEHEKLVVHRIELHRTGQLFDQTRSARVRLVAQESELERRMYNGGVTAFIVLSDVRVGDVIDVSYSVVGSAPILGGRYAAYFDLQGIDPVRQRHVEVIGQDDRPELRGKVLGSPPKGHSNHPIGPARVDLWDVEPRPDEDRVPAAYRSSWLELSEFGSWQEVAAWGAKLYPLLPASPEISEQAATLAGPGTEPLEAALRILRFVQDEVRYLAINNEGHALSPHPPRMVLAQRFGDCKDKTYLLLHLLRARGIDALPMLVHTGDKAFLAEHAPTPYAFDHVILRATIDGKVYFLDATYAQQGGTLATQAQPDYRFGLVLTPETTELEAIPLPPQTVPDERSETIISVASDGSALLDVTTTFAGGRADDMRDELTSDSPKEIGERYANYYQSEFPDVEMLQPLATEDDRLANRIVFTEHYRVPKYWRDGERSLYTEATDGYLRLPHVVRRTLPLTLSYPVWIQDVFRVVLPFRSSIESHTDVSTDGIVKFSRDIRNTGAALLATFEYRSLTDTVPVAGVPAHLEALQRARDWNTIHLADESADHASGAVAEPQRSRMAPMSFRGFWIIGAIALAMMAWPVVRGTRGILRRRELNRRRLDTIGETPARPSTAISLEAAAAVVEKLACTCGQSLRESPVQWTQLRYQGAALHAVRVSCPNCGEAQRRYFNIVAPDP
jgi:transglutaminase-like putative cysteine protease